MAEPPTTVAVPRSREGEPPPRSGRRPPWRAATALLAVLALAAAVLVWTQRDGDGDGRQQAAPVGGEDALHRRVEAELALFTDWLERNDAQGYIGEIGIPNDDDVDRWNALADRWFTAADDAGLWVDVWSAGEWWDLEYFYSPFIPAEFGGPLAVSQPTGDLLARQARESDLPRGVNLSGGEFGAAGGTETVTEFSNENPGEYDVDWHYDEQATFDYLAEQGIDTVRLPFRWERIQPVLGEELDSAELGRIRDAVGRAEQAGLEVILDVHNFAAYHLSDGTQGIRTSIGSAAVTEEHFADLWRRLSTAFAGVPGVAAYDLMNEPVDIPDVGGRTGAEIWESASQAAVDAIRGTGDETLIMVPGYRWSHVYEWPETHPDAWITDPAGNMRYAAHHYWLREEGRSYDDEVAAAEEEGY